MSSRLLGYRGRAAELLQKFNISVGDYITIKSDVSHIGVLMPRYHYSDDTHIILKLDSGYNVGISIQNVDTIIQHDTPSLPKDNTTYPKADASLPNILLLSTGGTIASRIDYRTGAVTPTLDAADLSQSVPELYRMANIHPQEILSEYSENITPEDWLKVAIHIHNTGAKYDGVVVAHGTDTMHYTSAFLSFALAGFPAPIILTGSQRSSDRASSDATLNLMGAVSAIHNKIPRGVYIAMHSGTSDDIISVHAGTRVRKHHTSSRGAFRTIGGAPLYSVRENQIYGDAQHDYYHDVSYTPRINISRDVALIKYHPGFDVSILENLISSSCRAVIFEGTGLGHVGREAYDIIKKMRQNNMFVGMTSQCIDGRVGMTVYESGRDLLQLGITPLYDMLAETALVKMMWVLGNELSWDIMSRPIASEMKI